MTVRDPWLNDHRRRMERAANSSADAAQRQADAAERTARGETDGNSDEVNGLLVVTGLIVACIAFAEWKFITSPGTRIPVGTASVVLVGVAALAGPGSGLVRIMVGSFFVGIFGFIGVVVSHGFYPDAERPVKWLVGALFSTIPVGVSLRAWLGRPAAVKKVSFLPKPHLFLCAGGQRNNQEATLPTGNWFIGDQGRSLGPYSLEQLRKFAHGGQLTGDTPICRIGSGQWGRAGDEIPDLFGATLPPNSSVTESSIVGQTITFEGMDEQATLRGTVVQVKQLGEMPISRKQSKGKYVLALMTVENLGKKSDTVSTGSFQLRDSQGRHFDLVEDASEFEEHFNREGCYSSIQPGLSEDLVFAFEVAKDSAGYALVLPDA